MKYEIDIESPNKVREWSRIPGVFNSVSEMMILVSRLFYYDETSAIRIRKIDDDNA